MSGGRKTEFINVAGLKISPVEIEAVLNSYPGVIDSVAIGIENSLYGQVVKGFVQLKPEVNVSERDLIKYCADKLAGFKVPKTIFMPRIQKQASGGGHPYIMVFVLINLIDP